MAKEEVVNMAQQQQRVVAARRAYFEDSGLLNEDQSLIHKHLLRSWDRCRGSGIKASHSKIEGEEFSSQALQLSLARNKLLLEHSQGVVAYLYDQIRDSNSMVLLSDADGLLLHALGDANFTEQASRVSLSPGAIWAESTRGTNAVGTALVEKKPVEVWGGEHYLESNSILTCSAVPLLDPCAQVVGVLDISGDHRNYQPHTLGLVRMAAKMIEQRMFKTQYKQHILLALHPRYEYMSSFNEGLLAVTQAGEILGIDASGLALLKLRRDGVGRYSWSDVFSSPLGELIDRMRSDALSLYPASLHNGGLFYLRSYGTLPATSISVEGGSQLYEADIKKTPSTAISAGCLTKNTVVPKANQLVLDDLLFGDPQIAEAVHKSKRVLGRDIPVLIQGESGVGKELFAKAFHNSAHSHEQSAYVALNCAAIPEDLVESELFGYQGGAFTGAKKDGAKGKIQQADGGTLFLDEIGDMPLTLQARLLRVLQERCITPLGSTGTIPVEFSLVCATHRHLKIEVAAGRFREDLYYRLNGLILKLPALRERTDLKTLVQRLMKTEIKNFYGDQRKIKISDSVMDLFKHYSWPGNIRQLHNVLRVSIALLDEGENTIAERHLPQDLLDEVSIDAPASVNATHEPASETIQTKQTADFETNANHPDEKNILKQPEGGEEDRLENIERRAIEQILARYDGNVSAAAKKLGISRNTLYRKLGRL